MTSSEIQAVKMDGEREALEHAAALVRILRSDRFRDVAGPEQQLDADPGQLKELTGWGRKLALIALCWAANQTR